MEPEETQNYEQQQKGETVFDDALADHASLKDIPQSPNVKKKPALAGSAPVTRSVDPEVE